MIVKRYKGKYRGGTLRAQWWNYGWNASYEVTINTSFSKNHFFGEVVNKQMNLSDIGIITENAINLISEKFPYAKPDVYVVMPNHVHLIIRINKPYNNCSLVINHQTGGFAGYKNPMLNDNLSRIIRWLKGRVTFESRKIDPNFAWQRNYYERIIQTPVAYHFMTEYIIDNPANWKK